MISIESHNFTSPPARNDPFLLVSNDPSDAHVIHVELKSEGTLKTTALLVA